MRLSGKELLKELEFCRDWLDVGESREDQENQLKVLAKLIEICDALEEEQDNISPCPKCECMTKSIRLGRAKYECGKCKADKSLSDVYFYEATKKLEDK